MYQLYELNIASFSQKMHTAILFFKCLNNQSSTFLTKISSDLSNPSRITKNCAHKCDILKVKLVFRSKDFYARDPQFFNSLIAFRIREENVFINFRKRAIEHFSNP